MLDDASFFEGDFRQRIPKHLHVIKTYIGDHGHEWCDDIRRVKSSTQSSFDYSDIDFFFPEKIKSHSQGDFKKGRLYGGPLLFILFYKLNNFLFSDRKSTRLNSSHSQISYA